MHTVGNRTRLAQEALLLVGLACLFFVWSVIGFFITLTVDGERLWASPLLLLLTLPAWPLWLLHGASVGLMGTSVFAMWFPTGFPLMELIALCAVLDAALVGISIIVYLRRHAW